MMETKVKKENGTKATLSDKILEPGQKNWTQVYWSDDLQVQATHGITNLLHYLGMERGR